MKIHNITKNISYDARLNKSKLDIWGQKKSSFIQKSQEIGKYLSYPYLFMHSC